MHHLRPFANRSRPTLVPRGMIRTGALVLALVPAGAALTSCGFDYPTDRVNTIAGGINDRDASVDALGIRVLASAQGEGRLIGALANNLDDDAALESVTSPEGLTAADFDPVEVAGRGTVNLANEDPIALTGDFTAGDFVELELGFSTGETVSMNVPVVKACFQYTQVPTPEAAESDAEAETEAETGSDAEHGDEGHGDATFNCADEAPDPTGGEH